MSFNIIPINTGYIKVSEGLITKGGNENKYLEIPSVAWYLYNNKEKILVDTGMCSTERANKWHHSGSCQPPGHSIDQQLLKIGVNTNDINTIIFTHLHWDHCSNLNLFENAKLIVSKAELDFAEDPIPPYYSAYEHPILGLHPPFEDKDFIKIEGEYKYNEDITIFPTPGHSVGHQSVLVKGVDSIYIIAGDAIYSKENLKGNSKLHSKFTPIGRYVNILDVWNSMEKIVNRGGIILPGHDISVFKNGELKLDDAISKF